MTGDMSLAFIIAVLLAALFAYLYFSLRSRIKEIRQDAIQRSQAVTLGKVTEHLVPFLPGFEFDPRDVRFLGSPIDLVVFDGLCNGEVKRVVFVEVKTGRSGLTPRERYIREAVTAKRVEWLEFKSAFQSV